MDDHRRRKPAIRTIIPSLVEVECKIHDRLVYHFFSALRRAKFVGFVELHVTNEATACSYDTIAFCRYSQVLFIFLGAT